MAESVECYEVLVRHTADLQLAVRENLTSLGSQLVAAKIITLDQYEEIRNPHRPVNERGADLVKYVQNKVRRDSRHYHAFIDALKSDLSQYGDILMKLEETRLSVASEQQPVIPQLPPPREDDNPLPAQDHNIDQRIKRLETKFNGLHQRLKSEVTTNRLTVDEFYQALATLPIAFRMEYERSIQQSLHAVEESDGQRVVTSRVFLQFSPLFVFIDYNLLDHMIKKFGSAELKSEMALYIEDVKIFMKETTVGDLIDHWGGGEVSDLNYAQLRAKFRDDPMTYTLERLNRFRRRFCSQVRISKLICCIISFESTESFFATWIIPAAIIPELSEAIQQLDESFFEEEHIISIFVDQKQLYPSTASSSGKILPSQDLLLATAATPISHDSETEVKVEERLHYNTPGLCVIINNMTFQNARELPEGKEGEQDLAALFITLGFDVKIHENLTADGMVQKAKFHGRKQHRGAFFFIILSHGRVVDHREAVVGTDCKPVTIQKLQTFFNATACPSLHGVPKIFLIDARQDSQQASTVPIGSVSTEFMIVHASTQRNQVSTDQDQGQDQDATCTLAQAFVEATNEADPSTPFTEVIERVKATVQESNPDQVVKTVDTLSQTCDYFIKREGSMPSIDELSRILRITLQQWISIREDTIQHIRNTIENLKIHHRNVNFTRIAGSALSIAGSAIAICSFVMAPSRASLSLVLTVGGAALAFAGGGTTAGASIADVLIQQSNVQQAQQQLTCDYEQLYVISALAKAIKSEINDNLEWQQCQGISTAELLAELGIALTHGVFQTGNLGIRIAEAFAVAFRTGGAAQASTTIMESFGQALGALGGGLIGARVGEAVGGVIGGLLGKAAATAIAPEAGSIVVEVLANAGVVLNVITIPIDLIQIIRCSNSLVNGSETDAIKELTDIVEKLEEERNAIALIQHAQE